jgi:hypothetical protein
MLSTSVVNSFAPPHQPLPTLELFGGDEVKKSITLEELDESLFWLETLAAIEIIS